MTFLELRSCVSRVRASVRILLLYPAIRKKGLTKNWFVEKNGTNAGQSLLQVGEVNEICKNKMEEMKCPKDLQLWYKNKCTSEMGWQYSNQAKKSSCKMTKDPVYKESSVDCLKETFEGQLQKEQTLLGHYFEYKTGEQSPVACHRITKWIKQPKNLIAKGTIKPFSNGEAVDLTFDQLGFWNFKE